MFAVALVRFSHRSVTSADMIFRAKFFPVGLKAGEGSTRKAAQTGPHPTLIIKLWDGRTCTSVGQRAIQNVQALEDAGFPVDRIPLAARGG